VAHGDTINHEGADVQSAIRATGEFVEGADFAVVDGGTRTEAEEPRQFQTNTSYLDSSCFSKCFRSSMLGLRCWICYTHYEALVVTGSGKSA